MTFFPPHLFFAHLSSVASNSVITLAIELMKKAQHLQQIVFIPFSNCIIVGSKVSETVYGKEKKKVHERSLEVIRTMFMHLL